MRAKLSLISLLLLLLSPVAAAALAPADNDTIYNPKVLYSAMPRTYTIAGINVEGAPNYDEFLILGYAGLKVGDRVTIPGDDISNAVKRLMRQTLFAQAQIVLDKTVGDKAWITIKLRTQPRIASIQYKGAKKSEIKDLDERLQLVKGNQITQNIVNRAESIIKKYYTDKGFGNATVKINLVEDLSAKNEMIVDINIDKQNKVKVHKIHINGNEVLSDRKIKNAMKKTNERTDIWKIFSQKKFVRNDYNDDLKRIIEKYNEKGYRDARIVRDSVAANENGTVDVYLDIDEGSQYFIKDITWVGNTIYPTVILDDVLGMKSGDVYNQTRLKKRLESDDDAVNNLYMNKGYLFYSLVPVERDINGDSISLEMRMIEGPQARINNVVINGNDRLYEKVIRRELRVRPGALFSKDDLMRSAREIAQTGHFNPEKMDIQPQPNEADGTVDIVFNLESKANDQVEFSLGWGQTGIIGKLQLKFTNFSLKNLFYPSTYRGIIPQGEGQTFSISAQTNARYYQSYAISFLDPWFGGKRPNSLSLSAYYSRQTGVNNSYYSKSWANSAMYGYGYGNYGYGMGGYYPNSYYNDYYQNSYQQSLDPNKYLQMVGVNLGFGKRLSWPDDWFTLTAELGYNWYNLKNWDYLYYMNTGTSHAIVGGVTIARNSTDNPIYTRTGSMFSVNLQMTPPAQLFTGARDWKKLAEENTVEAKKQRYEWIEYWKLRFKSRTYTPLASNPQWTPVFMTRFDFGLIGSYNKYLKTPFETFYVGGDGMSGYTGYATETIALRGYDNGSLTPYKSEGYAYSRLGMEVHFPLMLQQSTTIYTLAFVEGGNAWTSVSQFNPFSMKRSAGAGVRIMLPMVGLMGIDWAYGFDKVGGQRGGSHFHFILGQEF